MRTERYVYAADTVSTQNPPNVKVTGVIKLMCSDLTDSFVLQTLMLQSAEPVAGTTLPRHVSTLHFI